MMCLSWVRFLLPLKAHLPRLSLTSSKFFLWQWPRHIAWRVTAACLCLRNSFLERKCKLEMLNTSPPRSWRGVETQGPVWKRRWVIKYHGGRELYGTYSDALQDLKMCMQVSIMGFTNNNPHLWAKDIAQRENIV